MANVITDLMACQDCLAWVANGNLPDDGGFVARIALNLGHDAGYLCCGDSDNDDEFSWQPCECCGSTLGGSRHQLVVVR